MVEQETEVKQLRAAIYSLGCKVNIYESEYVTSELVKNGYTIVGWEEEADVYIINTCSVTNEADKKDRKIINGALKRNKDAITVVMGCHVQAGFPIEGANIVIGNKDKSKIVRLIEEYKEKKQNITRIYDLTSADFEDMQITNFNKHTRAFVKIQDGCNAFCTYCIIPYIRGSLRSKEENKVIAEVTSLTQKGFKEIVLTGIHTGRYGIDKETNLYHLLTQLVKIPNLYRIRLSSIEINEITPEIINLIKTNPIMAKHLHIPLQSGSNHILKMMNRKYNVDYYINKINEIRKEIPNISITTDLILGFPNETEENYQETLNTLNKIKFTKIHTFPYSRRKGTKADKMPNQINGKTKKERVREVLELSNKYEQEYYTNNLNKEYEIVTEDHKDKTIGYTTNYIPIVLPTHKPNNQVIKVTLTKLNKDTNQILGEIKEEVVTK